MNGLETVPGAGILVDDEYTVVDANIRAEIVFREDLDEIRGANLETFAEWGLFDSETLTEWKLDLDRVLKGEAEELSREISFTPAAEDEYAYNLRILAPPEMADKRARCTFRSVGTRQRYEETITSLHVATRELVEADDTEEVLVKTAEAAHDVLGFPGTGVRRYNPETEQLDFVAFGAVVNKVTDRPAYSVDDSPHGTAFREGRTVIDAIDPDNESYDREDFSQTMYTPIGETGVLSLGTVGNQFDETDVQFAEILAENASSAIKVVDTTNRLREQRERLDQFASIVSHDLRNPLNSAELYRDLAMETEELEYLEKVADAHERMNEMIENLLTMARIDARNLEKEDVNISSLVKRTWGKVAPADANLRCDLPSGWTVNANPDLLCHIFENMFRNAIEHTTTPVTVTVGALADVRGFYIEDDGSGIPPDEQELVFDYGHTTDDDGHGFGLAIVENVVEVHGWQIDIVESDTGARFEIQTA